MTNKKLGLLLLPLVPLSAIGIVSLVNRALPMEPPVCQPATAPALVEQAAAPSAPPAR